MRLVRSGKSKILPSLVRLAGGGWVRVSWVSCWSWPGQREQRRYFSKCERRTARRRPCTRNGRSRQVVCVSATTRILRKTLFCTALDSPDLQHNWCKVIHHENFLMEGI